MATTVTDAPAGSPVSAPAAVRPRGVAVSPVSLIGTPQCGPGPRRPAVMTVPPTSSPATPGGYDADPVVLMTAAAAMTGTRV